MRRILSAHWYGLWRRKVIFKTGGVIDSINTFIIGEIAMPSESPTHKRFARQPTAYIITDNRGKRYLVFTGSIEHQNAIMFGYKMRALYE